MPEPITFALVMAILSGGMVLAWIIVMSTGNGGWSDVVWTLTVGAGSHAAVAVQGVNGWRPYIAIVLIWGWSLRLAWHLAQRVAHSTEDFRYSRLRADWGPSYALKMLGFLQLQALFAVPLFIAVALAASRPGSAPDGADWIGIGLLLVSVAGAALSDQQLAAFTASKHRTSAVLDRGLWAWSRHPNFFFEWVGWCAWPVIAIGPDLALLPGAFALVAPGTMYFLLVHVTGIPPIEERMLRTRGEAYRAYQRHVPPFFPRPPCCRTTSRCQKPDGVGS